MYNNNSVCRRRRANPAGQPNVNHVKTNPRKYLKFQKIARYSENAAQKFTTPPQTTFPSQVPAITNSNHHSRRNPPAKTHSVYKKTHCADCVSPLPNGNARQHSRDLSRPLLIAHRPFFNRPFPAYRLPLTAYHLPLTTYHLPLTTYHLPLTTHHLPLTTHHSPLTTAFRLHSCPFVVSRPNPLQAHFPFALSSPNPLNPSP